MVFTVPLLFSRILIKYMPELKFSVLIEKFKPFSVPSYTFWPTAFEMITVFDPSMLALIVRMFLTGFG
jgi:hypothetical protein